MYGIFEAVNAYDQHGDYLRYVFKEKPSIEQVAKAMQWEFPNKDDAVTLNIINLWQGKSIGGDGSPSSEYTLREIKPGKQD